MVGMVFTFDWRGSKDALLDHGRTPAEELEAANARWPSSPWPLAVAVDIVASIEHSQHMRPQLNSGPPGRGLRKFAEEPTELSTGKPGVPQGARLGPVVHLNAAGQAQVKSH
jgi:hypothetical protein